MALLAAGFVGTSRPRFVSSAASDSENSSLSLVFYRSLYPNRFVPEIASARIFGSCKLSFESTTIRGLGLTFCSLALAVELFWLKKY